MSEEGASGVTILESGRVDPLRRALGIPYPWRIAAMWPLLHRRPSLAKPADFRALGPTLESPAGRSGLCVAFLGDIMPPGRDIEVVVDPTLREALGAADLVVANCETALGLSTHVRGTRYRLAARDFVRILAALGVPADRAVVSVANNHVEDHGADGMARTVGHLEDAGCRVVGTRRGGTDVPVIVAEVMGCRLGIAAWTHWRNRPVPMGLRPWAPRDVLALDWAALRRAQGLDALVGFPHWDLEFRHYPQQETRGLARYLAERGFDLLVGHHPHVVQGAERHGDCLAFYSCGNALTNSFCARSGSGRLSVLVRADLARKGGPGGACGYRADPLLVTRRASRLEIARFASSDEVPPDVRWRFDLLFPGGGSVAGGCSVGTPPRVG